MRPKVYEIEKVTAINAAKNFCISNNLSVSKLSKQNIQYINGMAVFAQRRNVSLNGLANDLSSQPVPTLVVKREGNRIVVNKTENTDLYLK